MCKCAKPLCRRRCFSGAVSTVYLQAFETTGMEYMTTGPQAFAERAAHFTFRDGLAIRKEAIFGLAVLIPLTEQDKG